MSVRTTLLVFALLCMIASTRCLAKCATASSAAWPPSGSTIPTNARIVLSAYGAWQEQVLGIRKLKPFLLCGAKRVRLEVIEVHAGQMRVAQAMLAPSVQLPPNSPCVLHFMHNDDHELLSVVHYESGRAHPTRMSWQTSSAADSSRPGWSGQPAAAARSYILWGCGPEAVSTIDVPVSDAGGPVAIHVSVRREGEQNRRSYLLEVKDGTIAIGHGMCSGPFILEPGARYAATLVAVDIAGNAQPAPGADVYIVGPGPDDLREPWLERR